MEDQQYDIAIVGAGPIGAATAYHLADSGKKIALISSEPLSEDPDHQATYLYAGGSVRWFFDDPEIAKMTETTAGFIRDRLKENIDLSAIEDSYVFVHRGLAAPSLNISGSKLVAYLVAEAEKKGVVRYQGATLKSFAKQADGYMLDTSAGPLSAKKVLLALGSSLSRFVPDAGFEFEKRQTFILGLPVPPERAAFPHLVMPLRGGIVYVFIKKVGNDLKMLVSQEGIVYENGKPEPDDYFKELCDKGLTDMMPFLKDAAVEKVLWGFDALNKKLKVYSPDQQLFAAACGSAIRGSISIGQQLADTLLGK